MTAERAQEIQITLWGGPMDEMDAVLYEDAEIIFIENTKYMKTAWRLDGRIVYISEDWYDEGGGSL